MTTYKRPIRTRPVLLKKPVPDCAKKYSRFCIGINEAKQFVFEFHTTKQMEAFLAEVGGAPAGPRLAVLAPSEDKEKQALQGLVNRITTKLSMVRHDLLARAQMPFGAAVKVNADFQSIFQDLEMLDSLVKE